MTHFWLLQAIGDVDPALVERAADPPRKPHPLRFLAAAAAAAVMLAGLGLWWHNRPGDTPPVTHPTGSTGSIAPTGSSGSTATTVTTAQSSPTTTTTTGTGTGGDLWSCDTHNPWYHTYDGALIAYVGADRFEAYTASLPERLSPDRTYPYHDCHYPADNVVAFVRYFGITRQQFIEAMGWGALLDHVFVDSLVDLDEPSRYLFTFGDFVDAIYGDDPHLTAWVFYQDISTVEPLQKDWPYQRYYLPDYDTVFPDPVVLHAGGDPWTEGGKVSTFLTLYGKGEAGSLSHFVNYFGITRDEFIALYGWEDKLDEKATDHFLYAPYTYRQFVDAVYGDDEALREWVFDRYVFHPDYPQQPPKN